MQSGLLVAASVAVYANGFGHAFQLDSVYGLVDNSAIRGLSNLPRFFVDPLSLTSLRANADYRPILQVTYAINYAISGEAMWSWHAVQVALHACCAVMLSRFARALFLLRRPGEELVWFPFFVGLLFALHPVNAGVVNYLWARSSLLVAAFLLPAFLAHLKRSADRPPTIAVALFALALLTKVEAIAALAVFLLCDVLRDSRPGDARATPFSADLRRLQPKILRNLGPYLIVAAVYGVVRVSVMPDFVAEARQRADLSSLQYLMTQVTVWWHYVARWFAPIELVADNMAYPVVRSPADLRFLVALVGWALVAMACKVSYPKHPEYTVLTLCALALISPTSSVAPLAEMANEHRPYLPMALLSLTWLHPSGVALRNAVSARPGLRRSVAVVGLSSLAVLALATWSRNQVFDSAERYWRDVVEKAPSARAHLNLAVDLMGQDRIEEAGAHLEQARDAAPFWHLVHVNLGILGARLGQDDDASRHFDEAVRLERFTAQARYHRGRFRLGQRRYREAATDLELALPLTIERFDLHKSLATAYAGLTDVLRSLEHTRACLALDPDAAEISIVEISTPYWDSTEGHEAGIRYFRALAQEMPGRWWIHENIAMLAEGLGRREEGASARARANALRQPPKAKP